MRLFFIAALALSHAYAVFSQQEELHATLTCEERAKQKGMPTDCWKEVYDDDGHKKCRRIDIQEICEGVEFIDVDTKKKGCCPDDTNFLTWIDQPAHIGKCCPVGTHMVRGQCVPSVPSVNPYPQTCGNGHGGVEPSCTCTNNPVCGHGKYLGIKYGHCYILSFSDGQQLGLNRDKPDYVKNGLFDDIPFKVCKSPTDCSSGEEVEMGQSFSLQDQHGLYDDVLGTKGWINNAFGGHSMFTPNGNEAGKFNGIPTCAGGECALQLRGGPINTALKFTCPTDTPSVSSYGNPKVGTKLRFSEVTCDDYEVPPTSGINQN
ncbi:hypothetical protein DEU56DRAFT_191462 [Suillus clintonianus]|uniref:uncharacterized protein n=1 Tax=Suillus clintonianus TaxID=1904413 RepID=UPI001B87B1C9|nr:uncharacterized protein DEU56DRAFT_191462 [Suillus clintonianus]KAG2113379.1 hypothetical protein DEU56DRAFT_191462 [Suillus clintonianus]